MPVIKSGNPASGFTVNLFYSGSAPLASLSPLVGEGLGERGRTGTCGFFKIFPSPLPLSHKWGERSEGGEAGLTHLGSWA